MRLPCHKTPLVSAMRGFTMQASHFHLPAMRVFPCLVLSLALQLAPAADPAAAGANPARWWKGNLHTHSLWSDGDDYPEMIGDWYKAHGYHFLALSDHNVLADYERWVAIAKTKGGQPAFDKYLARFGVPWVETRPAEMGEQVRLKMLSEFRVKLEEPGRFLMVQSEEISDRFLSAPIHINATNVQEVIEPQGGRSIVDVMQRNLAAVQEQRTRTGVPMFAHINHPNFGWALTAEELSEVEQEQFFEVYNGHPTVHNAGDVGRGNGVAARASTERIWDIVLTKRASAGAGGSPRGGELPFAPTVFPATGRRVLYGMATDDAHNYHATPTPGKQSRTGRGWVMVRAEKLDAASLIAAMEAGDFYASSGVMLRDVGHDRRGISIEIEPQPGVTFRTEFIGTRKGWDTASEPVLGERGESLRTTRRYSKDVGRILATAEGTIASYAFTGDELYVRARIVSSKLKAEAPVPDETEQAWTQPVVTGVR